MKKLNYILKKVEKLKVPGEEEKMEVPEQQEGLFSKIKGKIKKE